MSTASESPAAPPIASLVTEVIATLAIAANAYLERIEHLGGAVAAIEARFGQPA